MYEEVWPGNAVKGTRPGFPRTGDKGRENLILSQVEVGTQQSSAEVSWFEFWKRKVLRNNSRGVFHPWNSYRVCVHACACCTCVLVCILVCVCV